MPTVVVWTGVALALTAGTLLLFRPLVGHLQPRRPNVFTVLVIAHVAFGVVPAATFVGQPDRPRAGIYLAACLLTTPLLLLGLSVGHLLTTGRLGQPPSVIARGTDVSGAAARRVRSFLRLLIFAALVLTLVYVERVRQFPLKALLVDAVSSESLRSQRESASTQGTIFGVVRLFVMPFLFACVLTSWRVMRSAGQRWVGLLGLFVALFYNSFSSRKTPVVVLFAIALFVWLHERRTGHARSLRSLLPRALLRRRRRVLVLLGVATMVGLVGYPLLIFSFKPFAKNRSADQVFVQGILLRVAEVPASNSYFAFELYPSAGGGYTNGRDINLVASLAGRAPVDLSSQVARRQGFDASVNAPPASVGAFWAEGGWFGIAFGAFGAGATFGLVEGILARRKPDPIVLAFYVLLLFAAFRFSFGYFHAILLSETFVPMMGFLLLWRPRRTRRSVPAQLATEAPGVIRRQVPEEIRSA